MKNFCFLIFIVGVCLGQERYELNVSKDLIVLSRKIAFSFVGEKEIQPNRSPKIDKINQTIGNPVGSPYCQAGQYYSYYSASSLLKKNYDNWPVPKNGLAISTFNLAKSKGKKNKKYFAKEDDFIVWKAPNNHTGHIERVVKVLNKGWVETIGFNVSINQKEEGIWIKKRNIYFPLNRIKKIKGIVGVMSV